MDECLVYSPRLCVFLQMHIESIWYGMKENGSITIKDYRYSRDVVLCCVVLCCVVLCCGSVLGVCECIRGWRVCIPSLQVQIVCVQR